MSFASIKWIEGTADVRTDIMAPQGDISRNVKLTVPRTNVSAGSGPLTVPASGPIPSVLLSQTGQANVVVGAVVIHLATLTASGAVSVLGNISISCTLDSGQTGVVSSLQILPVASSAARSSSAARPAPRPTPTQTPTETPTPAPTRARTKTPAPSSSPGPQSASVKLLRHFAPFARSFPGFLLLALFLLCAAVLVILKAALRIFNIDLTSAVRNPSAKRSSPEQGLPTHRLEGVRASAHAWRIVKAPGAEPHAAEAGTGRVCGVHAVTDGDGDDHRFLLRDPLMTDLTDLTRFTTGSITGCQERMPGPAGRTAPKRAEQRKGTYRQKPGKIGRICQKSP